MAFLYPVTLVGTLSLIIQIVVFLLLFLSVSYKRKQKFRQHGAIMAVAVALHLIAIIVVMIPSFDLALLPDYIIPYPLMIISIIGLIHGVTGVVVLVLGVYLVAFWGFRVDVSGCFRRKHAMRITFATWFLTLIFGIALYGIFYGPLLFS